MTMPPRSPPPPHPPPSSSSSATLSEALPPPLPPHLLPNTTIPLSSNPTRPFLSSSASPSPTPLYTAQPLLPVVPKATSSHLPKFQDPSPPPPPPPIGVAYPVSRGFHPRAIRPSHSSDQMVTVANPTGYPLSSGRNSPLVGFPGQVRAFGFSMEHSMRPPQSPYVMPRPPMGSTNLGGVKSVPVVQHLKAPTVSTAADYNGYKDLRDKAKDDAMVTIYDRKVRMSDGGQESLYALCRSWVRNGLPQETQPQCGDGIKLLPRPLPASLSDLLPQKRTEPDEDEESSRKDEEGSTENLSARDLLEGHIKRAKRVRARIPNPPSGVRSILGYTDFVSAMHVKVAYGIGPTENTLEFEGPKTTRMPLEAEHHEVCPQGKSPSTVISPSYETARDPPTPAMPLP
ncbi:hypothetical protein ACLOJK_025494 [Asimina triloba]